MKFSFLYVSCVSRIQALADLSLGKKKIMVPYRDSVLTKLLQNALGGNRWEGWGKRIFLLKERERALFIVHSNYVTQVTSWCSSWQEHVSQWSVSYAMCNSPSLVSPITIIMKGNKVTAVISILCSFFFRWSYSCRKVFRRILSCDNYFLCNLPWNIYLIPLNFSIASWKELLEIFVICMWLPLRSHFN